MIVIVFSNLVSYNTPVIKVENGTQVQFLDSRTNVVFELCYISKPLLIGLVSVKSLFRIFSAVICGVDWIYVFFLTRVQDFRRSVCINL